MDRCAIRLADVAKVTGFRRARRAYPRAGHRREYRDFQRRECAAAAALAVSERGASNAYLVAVGQRDAGARVRPGIDRATETKPVVRREWRHLVNRRNDYRNRRSPTGAPGVHDREFSAASSRKARSGSLLRARRGSQRIRAFHDSDGCLMAEPVWREPGNYRASSTAQRE